MKYYSRQRRRARSSEKRSWLQIEKLRTSISAAEVVTSFEFPSGSSNDFELIDLSRSCFSLFSGISSTQVINYGQWSFLISNTFWYLNCGTEEDNRRGVKLELEVTSRFYDLQLTSWRAHMTLHCSSFGAITRKTFSFLSLHLHSICSAKRLRHENLSSDTTNKSSILRKQIEALQPGVWRD